MIAFLADAATYRLICVHREPFLLHFLHSKLPKTLFFTRSENFVSHGVGQQILKTSPEDLTNFLVEGYGFSYLAVQEGSEAIRLQAKLIARKMALLAEVRNCIDEARCAFSPPEKFGRLTFQLRKEQALKFRESGYNLDLMPQLLFLWQYADVFGISPKAAADELILQSQFLESDIWKSEGIKLKYFNEILICENEDAISQIHENFLREFYYNGLI